MGTVAAGQVVFLSFPFSDLSQSKLRPALLLANSGRADWIASQITSNPYGDSQAIELEQVSFASGGLQRVSYVRPGKLFTAHESLFVSTAGRLTPATLEKVRDAVVSVIRELHL